MFRTPLRCYLDKKANAQWFIDAIDPKFLDAYGVVVYVKGTPLLTFNDVEEILGSDPIIDGEPAKNCEGFAGYVYLIGKERFLVCGQTIYNMKTWDTYGESTWKILSRQPMILDQVAFYLDFLSLLGVPYQEMSPVQKTAFNMFKENYIVTKNCKDYIKGQRKYSFDVFSHNKYPLGMIYQQEGQYIYIDSTGSPFSAKKIKACDYKIGRALDSSEVFKYPLYPVIRVYDA